MRPTPHRSIIVLTAMARIVALMVLIGATSAWSQTPDTDKRQSDRKSPLATFQAFVSKADGQRCASYPSCSHYASQAFERHGAIVGWVLTCDRLLRCGRDETRQSPKVRTQAGYRVLDPVQANTFWWSRP